MEGNSALQHDGLLQGASSEEHSCTCGIGIASANVASYSDMSCLGWVRKRLCLQKAAGSGASIAISRAVARGAFAGLSASAAGHPTRIAKGRVVVAFVAIASGAHAVAATVGIVAGTHLLA